MDGICREDLPRDGKASLPGRLVVCFMLSLGVHSLLLVQQVFPLGYSVGVHSMDGLQASSRLQVFLAPQGRVVRAKQIAVDAPDVTIASGRPEKLASLAGRGGGIPAVLPEKEPELLSEIDTEIDDPRVWGFMILRLQIDESGGVAESEVIYAELPQDIADLLMKRFATARFKPAVRNGRVAEASILLRIDID